MSRVAPLPLDYGEEEHLIAARQQSETEKAETEDKMDP